MIAAAYIALVIFAATGFTISLYFTLVYYNRLEPDSRYLPQFCSMEKGTCTTVLGFQQARLLRFTPNFVLGLGYYTLIACTTGAALLSSVLPAWYISGLTVLSWLTVAMSFYLAWALVVVLKVPCKLCFTSHLVNVAIALILTLF